ncbi:MAG: transposase [Anaerolineae bacterium]|nr:transposase [Anaerolineae bacterium]
MYRKNTTHQQPALISVIRDLPEKQCVRLEQSWAGTFYREFFCRIEEDLFSVLYSDQPSRPNIPVNVLVGFGWSDEELYEAFLYNLQVRYALGYDRLGDGEFEVRTLYYFRQRLSAYNLKHGLNLLEKAFERITDQQILELKIRTGHQRMDSTQIASNILDASRLHLLVEGVQRLHRLLKREDRERLATWFTPFIQDSAGHYAYRVKGKIARQEHLQKVGQTLFAVLAEMKAAYQNQTVYGVVARLFQEHFHVSERAVQPKENPELPAGSLQSLDDLEATYRTKGTQHYKGYVANLTETCDPENEVQLITKVQVASNKVADSQLLKEALPNLKARTHLETLITDGAYPSESNDQELRDHKVHLIQTGIRGAQPDPRRFNLTDFQFEQDQHGNPTCVTCPNGQTALATRGKTSGWFARFSAETCVACPFQLNQRCRARPQKRDPRYFIDLTLQEFRVAQRRKDYLAQKQNEHHLRPAVEATLRSLKHPFPAGKLPVRGKFRMTCLMIASAILVNVRRIWKHQTTLERKQDQNPNGFSFGFFSFCQNLFRTPIQIPVS